MPSIDHESYSGICGAPQEANRAPADRATAEDGVWLLRSLLVACARGDEAAFGRVYELTARKMFGVALMILRRSDLAEEVIQEAYIRIWHKAGQYDPSLGSPITWMVTIVRNLAIDARRRTVIESGGGDEDVLSALPSLQESALENIEASEQRGLAFAALKALDPFQRTLIVAAYVRGESREQLAARFGRPVSTIKTWLRRALLQVQISQKAVAE
jgi:RNA polymerase sigma-70 factor, ECF subfamily